MCLSRKPTPAEILKTPQESSASRERPFPEMTVLSIDVGRGGDGALEGVENVNSG
jgi:hypothetical protein